MTFLKNHFWRATFAAPALLAGIIWGCAPSSLVMATPAASAPASIRTATVLTNALAAGTRFATEYYIHDSGVAGPTVMIVGGAHGNEPAGAAAAESIRHWPITMGKLVVLPRANVPGLDANKRLIPGLDADLRDLNRNYPRAGRQESARGELAQAIWAVALEHKPDWLLDLHEGYDFNQLNEKSVGSSVIAFQDERGKAAGLMLAAVNATIPEEKLKFTRRGPPIDGSLARAAGEHLKIPAMTLETTSRQDMAKRVNQHETMVRRLFEHAGLLGQRPIRVALYKGPGTGGAGPPNLMKRLARPGISSIEEVSPEDIRSGALASYDVVIFAGGSASKQAEALEETGREAVRQFVGDGGGYVGICAGAYLATSGFSWGLNLVNARTVSPKWRRGRGDVKMELTATGSSILGGQAGRVDVRYVNGPIVAPAGKEELPPFDTLAYFRTELAENDTPVGVMVNSPAIFSGAYNTGRVVCISPHPEQTDGLEEIVPRAVAWTAAGHTGAATVAAGN
jgi:predicted deacylase/putative intracellular protease/amidase